MGQFLDHDEERTAMQREDMDIEFLASPNWDDSMAERLEWLRENDPVYWSEKDQLWIITRFEDVAAVSKNQDLFTSAEGVRPRNPARLGLIDEAEPRHGVLRGMINRGFSPRMVNKLEEIFRKLVTNQLDEVASKGECDFVESVSVPVPLRLIAAMMGIPPEDYDRFHHWSDTMIAGDGNLDNPEIAMKAGQAFVEYSQYVTPIIEDRRKNPQEDLVSILVHAKDEGKLVKFDAVDTIPGMLAEGEDLANDELIMLLVILMVAGNETTRNGISGGLQLLIENPGERQKLIDDPSLIPDAVEEMVRLVSPVRSFGRTVTRDTELRGKKLRQGDKVLIVYPTANTDPREFDDPKAFRIDRRPHHLGFGIGSHFCLGANLARMEMRVVFEEVLKRLPDMQYSDGGPVLKPSALVRTCTQMKVKYTAEAA